MTYYAIVRGPLGVGKTEVSRRVAAAIGGTHVSIDEILATNDLEEWDGDAISEASFRRANRFAVERARAALDGGTPAVIDGNFYWRSAIEELVEQLSFPHLICTLNAPLARCIERDAARASPHGAEATRQVYERTMAFSYGTVIDATRSLAEVVSAVLCELRRLDVGGA